jgi:hypothetical protein
MDRPARRKQVVSNGASDGSTTGGSPSVSDRTGQKPRASYQRRRIGPTVSWYGRLLIVGALLVAMGWELFRLMLVVLSLD